jgi:hypothetical protein|tara:strand:- start:858 stop:1034 length:177 start_codon:yes stop_codon:yes gene_type:complete
MKDIFKAHPLATFPSITFYTCDVCGTKNPASHITDDIIAPWMVLCQPCADKIKARKVL